MKRNSVWITGADRGIGFALCQEFIRHGWNVFAGQFLPEWPELAKLQAEYPEQLVLLPLNVGDDASVRSAAERTKEICPQIDMLINCAGVIGADTKESMERMLNVNSIGPLRMAEAFLPLMAEGKKRLCFVSSEAGSVSLAHRQESFGYCMSKTALNMSVRLMFRELGSKGYTFRLYHPGWVRSYMLSDKKATMGNFEPEETAAEAYRQFTEERTWEDALVMTDVSNEMWPF